MLKIRTYVGFFLWILVFLISCRDEISFDSPGQAFRLSTDTLFIDTVYHQVRSETYAIKIYNKENKDVQIPRIFLEGGLSSPYRINVDGTSGTNFKNIPLRAKDSVYVFVEIAPSATSPSAIAEDLVRIESSVAQQKVRLFSVVQDAEFFISTNGQPIILNQNTQWSNEKAKIIFGNLELAAGKSLNISKNTKVYFHKNSKMIIDENATLNILGELNQEVIFRGARNDANYDTLPAYWGGVIMKENSVLNMNYARMFGGYSGLSLIKNQANITNSIIFNFQDYGIQALNSVVDCKNVVLNHCGNSAVRIFAGGTYSFLQSTIVNYWHYSGFSTDAVVASNQDTNNTSLYNPLNLSFRNSIIYNDTTNAIDFKNLRQNYNYNFENCLIKHEPTASGFSFENNPNVISCWKNTSPDFQKKGVFEQFLKPKTGSFVIGKGKTSFAQQIPFDIKNINRSLLPTLGAYQ